MSPHWQTHVHKDDTSRRANRRAIPVTRGCVTPVFTRRRKRMTMHMYSPAVMRVMTPLADHMATPQRRHLYRGGKDGEKQCVTRGLIPRLDTCRPIHVTIRPDTGLTTDVGTRMSLRLTSCGPADMATGMQTAWNMRVTRSVQIRRDMTSSGRRTSGVAKRAVMPMRSGL